MKIFDSTTHPTLSGIWKTEKKIFKSSFKDLINDMRKNGITKSCAMGLDKFEDYNHTKFIYECKKYKNLIPIAGLNPNTKNIKKEIKKINELGFKGVKIHPRISKIHLEKDYFIKTLENLEKNNLILMLCTYPFARLGNNQPNDFLGTIYKVFNNFKKLKTILVHGGSVRVLEFAEFVRNNKENFLLDLSMTMQKYQGSSLDQDIKFLFKNFDERICIGSDYPEMSQNKLIRSFKYYSKNISKKKKENIAFNNLNNFFK